METNDSHITDKILDCAKQEFLKKGFNRALIEEISIKAGDATGMLYGKFTDKDELFRLLVKESADKLSNYYEMVLDEFICIPYKIQTNEMNSYVEVQIDKVIDILYENFDNYKLLFFKSKGSEFEYYREKLYDLGTKNIISYRKGYEKENVKIPESAIRTSYITFFASGIIMSIEEIIKNNLSKEKAKEYFEKDKKLCYSMAQNIGIPLINVFKKMN